MFAKLHAALAEAARNQFAEICSPSISQRLIELTREVSHGSRSRKPLLLKQFIDQVEQFSQATRFEKMRIVALGLRLCTMYREKAIHVTPETAEISDDGNPTYADEIPLSKLKGVGPSLYETLRLNGLETVEDLLFLLPRDYLDHRNVVALETIRNEGTITTRAVVVQSATRYAKGRTMFHVDFAAPSDESEEVRLRGLWFHAYPVFKQKFTKGTVVRLSGEAKRFKARLQMIHPHVIFEKDTDDAQDFVEARYPSFEGIGERTIRKLCRQACLSYAEACSDVVTPAIQHEFGLPSQADALRKLHLIGTLPEPDEIHALRGRTHRAFERIVYDELLSLQLALSLRRRSWQGSGSIPCGIDDNALSEFMKQFPFALTAAQRRALAEIFAEMRTDRPMHRLLQGDVGSGKTIVAFAACFAAIECGYQAALMAPTEILAQQHYRNAKPLFEALGKKTALLTASFPKAVKETTLSLVEGGAVDLVIGTHALLIDRLRFPRLALTVIDEQHRFGVLQRARLRQRGETQPEMIPHMLVMTATPIPRTLALTIYGDLEVSVIDEKPPGRTAIVTTWLRHATLTKASPAYSQVYDAIAIKRQVFVVCPLIDPSELIDIASVTSTTERLRALFPHACVEHVHGKMKGIERDQIMTRFHRGDIDILVATTMIEIGIDVPTANLMVIEHAERFGLAQLHQLRGRVGRGETASRCLLLADVDDDSLAAERLRLIERTEDGFEISEGDLQLRGPGELYGTRQTGMPKFRFADLRRHLDLFHKTREIAQQILKEDPELVRREHRTMMRTIQKRWSETALPGAEAG